MFPLTLLHPSFTLPQPILITNDPPQLELYLYQERMRAKQRRGPLLEELPLRPPPEAVAAGMTESRVLVKGRGHRYFKGMMLIEADDRSIAPIWGRRRRHNDAERIIYVSEPDGTIRTPTWDERRAITSVDKHHPSPTGKSVDEKRFFADDY